MSITGCIYFKNPKCCIKCDKFCMILPVVSGNTIGGFHYEENTFIIRRQNHNLTNAFRAAVL